MTDTKPPRATPRAIDPEAVASLVAGAYGIRLTGADAARLAGMVARTGAHLDAAAGGPLFDTEPAQTAPMLARLAGRAGR